MFSREKVDAVYDLREAVEEKTRLEVALEEHPTPSGRDRLLEATLKVEDRTQHAIAACHACGRAHQDDVDGCDDASTNVVQIDFAGRSRLGVH